jgi:hypothetical protein
MELGVRQIRTAGQGSGSVELTLPRELRQLVGLPCYILLQDGEQPDIVLRPDLSYARTAFSRLWDELVALFARERLHRGGDRFPAGAFSYGLPPRPGAPGAPYLSWQDGLALASSAPQADCVARAISACTAQLATDIGIAADLAAPFGAVCGFIAGGQMAFGEWQEPCDIAAADLAGRGTWQPGQAWAACPNIVATTFWSGVAPPLCACAELFAAWSLPGSPYAALRTAWRRGRSIELNRG